MKNIKIKEYNYGENYYPKLFIRDGKIIDATCKCTWSLNNPKAFKEGNTLCKHIICAIKEYYLEMTNKKKKSFINRND